MRDLHVFLEKFMRATIFLPISGKADEGDENYVLIVTALFHSRDPSLFLMLQEIYSGINFKETINLQR